jgi:hypothetical protein
MIQNLNVDNDVCITVFKWPNPSKHTIAQGSTQLLTEMSTRDYPGAKGRPEHKADNLTSPHLTVSWLSRKCWEPWQLTTLWACMSCYRDIKNKNVLELWIVPPDSSSQKNEGYGLNNQQWIFGGERDISVCHCIQAASSALSRNILGTIFHAVFSLPSSSKIQNAWNIICINTYISTWDCLHLGTSWNQHWIVAPCLKNMYW